MEDKQILIGKYMYQFRIDLSENRWNEVLEFMNRENFEYLGKFEIGEKTKKPHYQSVIWSDKVMSANDKNVIRAQWKKDKELSHKNSISITTVKKPESILKYVTKDKGKCYTSLSNEQLSKVGTWQTAKDGDEKILEHMTNWVEQNSEVYIEYEIMRPVKYKMYSGTVKEFVTEYFTCYSSVNGTMPTNRQKWKIWKMMLKLQVVPLEEYIAECRII